MPFSITCQSCRRLLRAKDEHAGKTLKCPGCEAPIDVPATALSGQEGEWPQAEIPTEPSSNKYCGTCGNGVMEQAIACMKCGVPPKSGKDYCYHCGTKTRPEAIICVKCGMPKNASGNLGGNALSINGSLSLWGYFTQCFVKYADFSGRARRREYWGFILFCNLFSLPLGFLSASGNPGVMVFAEIIGLLFGLAALIPAWAVTCRRFHDIGMSALVGIPIFALDAIGTLLSIVSTIMTVAVVRQAVNNPFGTNANAVSALEAIGVGELFILFLSIIYILIFLVRDSVPDNQYGPNPKAA